MTDMTNEQVAEMDRVTTARVMAQEMEIKRAAVTQVRRSLYGPRLAPGLRDQARSFVSFGTIIKVERMRDVYPWN